MKPESAEFLDKAHRTLEQARTIRDAGIQEVAARLAYLAGFHAAQAVIFERIGRVLKTHNGVHAEFSLATRDDVEFPADLRGFLSRAYQFKAIADYGVGPQAKVTRDEASGAIVEAERMILFIETVLRSGRV